MRCLLTVTKYFDSFKVHLFSIKFSYHRIIKSEFKCTFLIYNQ